VSSQPSARRAVAPESVAAEPLAHRLRRWLADWLPALPLLLVAFGMLILPVVALLAQSFQSDDGGLTLANWVATLASHNDQRAIGTSLAVGALCATIALLAGAPIAWFVSRMLPVRRATWLAVLNVAANFGGIGLAFAYVATLGAYGMVTLALNALSVPFGPPAPGSLGGLVIAYEYTNIPLFVLLTIPAMGILRPEWWEAAQTASATRLQFWRAIGLPILAPFLAAGWMLIFTWSIGLYGLPFALGAGSASSRVRLITLEIGDILQASISGQGRAAVMAMILLLIGAVSLVTYRELLRRALRWF